MFPIVHELLQRKDSPYSIRLITSSCYCHLKLHKTSYGEQRLEKSLEDITCWQKWVLPSFTSWFTSYIVKHKQNKPKKKKKTWFDLLVWPNKYQEPHSRNTCIDQRNDNHIRPPQGRTNILVPLVFAKSEVLLPICTTIKTEQIQNNTNRKWEIKGFHHVLMLSAERRVEKNTKEAASFKLFKSMFEK